MTNKTNLTLVQLTPEFAEFLKKLEKAYKSDKRIKIEINLSGNGKDFTDKWTLDGEGVKSNLFENKGRGTKW